MIVGILFVMFLQVIMIRVCFRFFSFFFLTMTFFLLSTDFKLIFGPMENQNGSNFHNNSQNVSKFCKNLQKKSPKQQTAAKPNLFCFCFYSGIEKVLFPFLFQYRFTVSKFYFVRSDIFVVSKTIYVWFRFCLISISQKISLFPFLVEISCVSSWSCAKVAHLSEKIPQMSATLILNPNT